MKKLIIGLIIVLSSCAKIPDIKSCHYGVLISSYIGQSNQDICQTVYDAIDNAKFNRRISDDLLFGIDSVLINFQFENKEDETYFINKEGILTYQIKDIFYQTTIDKKLYSLIIEEIELEKQSN
jgi:hypothetical protein